MYPRTQAHFLLPHALFPLQERAWVCFYINLRQQSSVVNIMLFPTPRQNLFIQLTYH